MLVAISTIIGGSRFVTFTVVPFTTIEKVTIFEDTLTLLVVEEKGLWVNSVPRIPPTSPSRSPGMMPPAGSVRALLSPDTVTFDVPLNKTRLVTIDTTPFEMILVSPTDDVLRISLAICSVTVTAASLRTPLLL